MFVVKYECECIENMEQLESYKNCINKKNCSYLTVPENDRLNRQKVYILPVINKQ